MNNVTYSVTFNTAGLAAAEAYSAAYEGSYRIQYAYGLGPDGARIKFDIPFKNAIFFVRALILDCNVLSYYEFPYPSHPYPPLPILRRPNGAYIETDFYEDSGAETH